MKNLVQNKPLLFSLIVLGLALVIGVSFYLGVVLKGNSSQKSVVTVTPTTFPTATPEVTKEVSTPTNSPTPTLRPLHFIPIATNTPTPTPKQIFFPVATNTPTPVPTKAQIYITPYNQGNQ